MKKTIYVHVGPPKTGTSVLQSWLNENQDILKQKSNVHYPAHATDQNQISSGHNHLILDKGSDGKSIFNHKKFNELLQIFENEKLNILLISSEYFFYQIPSFIEYSDKYNIEFIAYIRPEFEFLESVYNQSVKRNGQSQPIPIRANINNTYLNMLIDFIDKYGKEHFQLRAYGSRNFFSPNIIVDFLTIFTNAELFENEIEDQTINSSYSFESLEFKRWTNSFPIGELDLLLDKKLQSYKGSLTEYSLIPLQIYNNYKAQSVSKIDLINKMCPIYNYKKLNDYISLKSRPTYMHQELNDSHLIKIVTFLCENDLVFVKKLLNSLNEKEILTERDKQRLEIFNSELKKYQREKNIFISLIKNIKQLIVS